MDATIGSTSSFWCYRCNRFIRARIRAEYAVNCPDCGGGFVEQIGSPPPHHHQHRFPAASMYPDEVASPNPNDATRFRRNRRNGGDRSPFNPVIVLRGPPDSGGEIGGGGGGVNESDRSNPSNFELYYDDGAGSGLRPLPASMSEFLMGSGFDRLLEQLSQLEINGVGRLDQPPASKAAIESMPVVKIMASHVSMESHCAVCKEQFELDVDVREMPCKHIYHPDCILPWLSLRNSCPVCRHELPTDVSTGGTVRNSPEINEEEAVGLTIWRLPGGGFAVGRFTGGRLAAEREQLPVVFTEMDGGFNNGGVPRMISWTPNGRRARESRGLGFGRVFRGFVSLFRGIRPSRRSREESRVTRRTQSVDSDVFDRALMRRGQAWDVNERRW
ncbi:hypothetical protein ACFE04_000551 [Oxalis oulophora]